MRARIRDAFEILVRIDLGLQQEAARHQMARGARLRAEADLLAFEVGEGLDAGIGLGDEYGAELGVFLALCDRNNLAAGTQLRLYMGEAAEPDQVNLLVDQRLDCGGIVVDGRELHFHADGALEVAGQRSELADLLGGGLLGDRGDLEGLLGERRYRGQCGESHYGEGVAEQFSKNGLQLRCRTGHGVSFGLEFVEVGVGSAGLVCVELGGISEHDAARA